MKKHYKVAGTTYTIQEVDFVEIDGDRNFQELCDYLNCEIKILSSLSPQRKRQTLIHELTHAIFYEAGYEEQDEGMINRIGLVLNQFLNDLEEKSC